jgi:hypothetical protein
VHLLRFERRLVVTMASEITLRRVRRSEAGDDCGDCGRALAEVDGWAAGWAYLIPGGRVLCRPCAAIWCRSQIDAREAAS